MTFLLKRLNMRLNTYRKKSEPCKLVMSRLWPTGWKETSRTTHNGFIAQ